MLSVLESAPLATHFSALQRAEIAEIRQSSFPTRLRRWISVLFNEPKLLKSFGLPYERVIAQDFSALQRAEIAEIPVRVAKWVRKPSISVLFNEPKLLKLYSAYLAPFSETNFSALQRAEIAEISRANYRLVRCGKFQCSSTSRNC